ncbi:AbrB/MazE/SpoVT family DNA-binding domain-containing protein [Anaerocolumna jejuensis]|uniref:AbrB/MazE/SpoVT family DNA-binding domain-containing protein n=1 Tax=Anaerocolumna jejuensis TaxID=259063 RepID=UPI003F7C1FB7
MKNLGVIRRLDDLGRICLPKEFRTVLGIQENDKIEITCDSEGIHLKPVPKAVCMACGGTENLIEKGGKHICHGCLEGFAEEAGM